MASKAIGKAAKLTRRRANQDATPVPDAPSAPNGTADKPSRRRATRTAAPNEWPPSAPTTDVLGDLIELARRRRMCIRSQSRCDRSIEQYIATMALGYRPLEMTKDERQDVFRRAAIIRRDGESGEGGGPTQHGTQIPIAPSLFALLPAIRASAAARGVWDKYRPEIERDMARLVMRLPIWQQAQHIRGLGALGVAVIVSCAAIPLEDYRTVSGLWRHLGAGVSDGRREVRSSWGELWPFICDSLLRAQRRKHGEEVVNVGSYGEVYTRRRAHTEPRIAATADLPFDNASRWSLMRCHRDAQRVMAKALLCDLWRFAHGLSARHEAGEASEQIAA